MKILLLTGTTDNIPFRKLISGLDDTTHEYDVCSAYGDDKNVSLQKSVTSYLSYIHRVRAAIGSSHDLIHANDSFTPPVAILQSELPVVASFWGSDLYGFPGVINRGASQFCEEVITKSEPLADRVPGDTHIIPSGVDTDVFKPMDKMKIREELNWDKNCYQILFPYSPDRPEKNYELAEAVITDVEPNVNKNVKLNIVTGQPHSNIPLFMNASDALLLTSNREGSPKSIKEAMACNLPIVSTDVGDIRERTSGVSLTRIGDNKRELSKHLQDVLIRGERSNGRINAESLSWENTINNIIDVYYKAIETNE